MEFTGTGGANRGAYLETPLVAGADGTLYGSALAGGASDNGTLFFLRLRDANTDGLLISMTFETAGTRVRWQAPAGQVSRVQYSDNLKAAWQTVAGTITASPGGVAEYLDTTQPRPGQRYYRLLTP